MPIQLIWYAIIVLVVATNPCCGADVGSWRLVVENAGVASMHAALLPGTNRIVMFDRTNFGPSNISLPNGKCRTNDQALNPDCTAHSIELDMSTSQVRALEILTDTWCSSGAFAANGTLVQTGGDNDGAKMIRYFVPCTTCDWLESGTLVKNRWYASNQILPDNRVFVVGGRGQFNYEFVPKQSANEGAFDLQLLKDTSESIENNLYPFLSLCPDGNIFIFANNDSILFNYKKNEVVKKFPRLDGGGRNYPSSGSSVLLPLLAADNFQKAEVMVCGGAPAGSYQHSLNGVYDDALATCGRMVITDANPTWTIETMPMPRVMSDMVILPTGDIIIINGAQKGTSGWGQARVAILSPVLYNPISRTFTSMANSTIPRMYHSTSTRIPDGRVVAAGSNSHFKYEYTGDFPTELRIDAFSPPYLNASNDAQRPNIISNNASISYNSTFEVIFSVTTLSTTVEVNLYAPAFSTHAYSMGQRMLTLSSTTPIKVSLGYQVTVTTPPNANVAPSGYYLLTVVNGGIPSTSTWVQISESKGKSKTPTTSNGVQKLPQFVSYCFIWFSIILITFYMY